MPAIDVLDQHPVFIFVRAAARHPCPWMASGAGRPECTTQPARDCPVVLRTRRSAIAGSGRARISPTTSSTARPARQHHILCIGMRAHRHACASVCPLAGGGHPAEATRVRGRELPRQARALAEWSTWYETVYTHTPGTRKVFFWLDW